MATFAATTSPTPWAIFDADTVFQADADTSLVRFRIHLPGECRWLHPIVEGVASHLADDALFLVDGVRLAAINLPRCPLVNIEHFRAELQLR